MPTTLLILLSRSLSLAVYLLGNITRVTMHIVTLWKNLNKYLNNIEIKRDGSNGERNANITTELLMW